MFLEPQPTLTRLNFLNSSKVIHKELQAYIHKVKLFKHVTIIASINIYEEPVRGVSETLLEVEEAACNPAVSEDLLEGLMDCNLVVDDQNLPSN